CSRLSKRGGWGGRIRTYEWRLQRPLPYHLATPHQTSVFNPEATCASGPTAASGRYWRRPLLTQQSKIFCPAPRTRPPATAPGFTRLAFGGAPPFFAVKDRKERRAAARNQTAACARLLQPPLDLDERRMPSKH